MGNDRPRLARPAARAPTEETLSVPRPDRAGHRDRLQAYWKENFRLIMILTAIWALASFAHPPFAKALNNVSILTGFPLGYWLSSQFSITVFVILIFTYAIVMNKVIDPKYGFNDEEVE
jgi:putative solute:sodium symporter small subunit